MTYRKIFSNFIEKVNNDSEALLQWLKLNKPSEEFVFSHGDYCFPNIFIEEDKILSFVR